MKLKLLDKWQDHYYGVKNCLYEFPNGVRLVYTCNPHTVDFNLSVVVKAGSFFERKVGVPHGTAHYLEHIMAGNPNAMLKNDIQYREYAYGTKTRAGFYPNASTGVARMSFYAHGHKSAANRILDYIYAQLSYPSRLVPKYMEKQRNIILGEVSRRYKDERNESLQHHKFVYGDIYPEYAEPVDGTSDSVRSITEEHISRFREQVFIARNAVIAVQAPTPLDGAMKKKLEKIAYTFADGPGLEYDYREFKPKFKFKHFHNPDIQGIFFSQVYYYPVLKHNDYSRSVHLHFMGDVILKVADDYLREDRHLTYGMQPVDMRALLDHKGRGLSTVSEREKFLDCVNGTDEVLHQLVSEFLHSTRGRKWLNNEASTSIFKRNRQFNYAYAEHLAIDLLNNEEYKFSERLAARAAKQVTASSLDDFTKKFLQIEPTFWITSALSDVEGEELFKQSEVYAKYSK